MSGSNGFLVDLDALGEVRGRVGRLLDGLTETTGQRCPPSVFGHTELAAAAEQFHDRWAGGIGELASTGRSIQDRLGETINAYRRVDADALAEPEPGQDR